MREEDSLTREFISGALPVVEQLSFAVMCEHDDKEGLKECASLLGSLMRLAGSEGAPKELLELIVEAEITARVLAEGGAEDPLETSQELKAQIRRIQETIREESFKIGPLDFLGEEPPVREGSAPEEEQEKEAAPDAREVADEEGAEEEGAEKEKAEEEKAAGTSFMEELLEDKELFDEFLAESRDSLGSIEVEIVNLEKSPEDVEIINAVFRPFHTIKGVSGFLNLTEINHLTHKVETLLDEARSGKLTVTDEMIDLILEAVDILKDLLDELEGAMGRGEVPGTHPEVEDLVDRVEGYVTLGGPPPDAPVEEEPAEPDRDEEDQELPPAFEAAKEEERIAARPAAASKKKVSRRAAIHTVKVDTEKLDYLVDMVGELVIAQSMVAQDERLTNLEDQRLQKNLGQVHRIMSELQRVSMSLRMVPIKHTFEKMIRLVRDLAKKSGKRAELKMRGEDTEIDRLMVEEIYEPLVHMIRNAVDHGLEDPEERKMAGKPATGTIHLEAYHQGGNVVIEVAEDGRGLDLESIHKKAVERGIISPDESLSDSATAQLIFHPGFSTAKELSDVSGRGVGMDVVKRSIERLRGKIETESTPGEGTTFTLQLPLTLAIIDGMLVRVGRERYIIPTLCVHEALRPREDEVSTVRRKGEMIMVRGSLLPLVRLHELFNTDAEHLSPWDSLVVVVEGNGQRKCLMVDELLGKQEVVIKNLGGGLNGARGISGAAILGDGRVGLILDVDGICQMLGGKAR